MTDSTARMRAQVPPPHPGWLMQDATWQGYLDLDAQGRTLQGGVILSTGNHFLDRQTIDALFRAAPLPPIPSGAPIRLTVWITFTPNEVWDIRISPSSSRY